MTGQIRASLGPLLARVSPPFVGGGRKAAENALFRAGARSRRPKNKKAHISVGLLGISGSPSRTNLGTGLLRRICALPVPELFADGPGVINQTTPWKMCVQKTDFRPLLNAASTPSTCSIKRKKPGSTN